MSKIDELEINIKANVSVDVGNKSKKERLEDALLAYIENQARDTQPEIAATIPTAAMALIELWKTI